MIIIALSLSDRFKSNRASLVVMSSSTRKTSSNSKTITVKAYVTSLAGSIGVKGNPDLKFNPEAWNMWCSFQRNKPSFHVPKENIKDAQDALLKHFNIAVEVVALSGEALKTAKQWDKKNKEDREQAKIMREKEREVKKSAKIVNDSVESLAKALNISVEEVYDRLSKKE